MRYIAAVCVLLVSCVRLAHAGAVQSPVLLETAASTQVGTVTLTGYSVPASYVWPVTFTEAGKGGVVFTLESVATIKRLKTTLYSWYSWWQPQYIYEDVPAKTLNDVRIGISTRSTSELRDPSSTDPFLELVLGAADNTRLVVRRVRGSQEIYGRNGGTGATVGSGQTYWVTLNNNKLKAGTGSQINTNVFLDLDLATAAPGVFSSSTPYQGRYVGFSCPTVPQTFQQISLVADCVVSDFDAGTTCSATCGGGQFSRKRTITAAVSGSEYGAANCPPLSDTQPCNTRPCPVDCQMNEWSSWGGCSNPCTCERCPSPYQKRTRTQKTSALNGGANCPNADEPRNCNTQSCPIDCDVTEWSEFGDCSQQCGGTGVHTRFRAVSRPAQFGGAACPDLSHTAPCNVQPCPIDCVQTDWSPWTDCSQPCGTGTQERARQTTTEPNYGGTACGALLDNQECNKQPCPINCDVEEWTAWGDCDQPCGTGTYTRVRTVKTPKQFGGAECPELSDKGACNTQECPVDKLAVLIKRIRHLELQDRVNSLEETTIQDAQKAVSKTAFDLASQAATPVSTISLKETVTHGAHAHAHAEAQAQVSSSQQLSHMHPTLVAAAHPYVRPSITQMLQSEVLVDELAKFAERHHTLEQRRAQHKAQSQS